MVQAPIPAPRAMAPSYTGGEAIPEAISSITNLRTIRQKIIDQAARLDGRNRLEIPNVGYAKSYLITLTGTLDVTLGTGTITAGDPRKLVKNLAFNVQSAVDVHELAGVEENLLNMIDFTVVNARQQFTVANGSNAFYLELLLFLPLTEENLNGIIYKGGGSTVPILDLVLGNVGDITTVTGGATRAFSSLNVRVYETRFDAEAPRNPERVVRMVNGQEQEVINPGRGLWQETSQYIETVVDREVRINGPNQDVSVDMQLGSPYLRILMVSYLNNEVDSGDVILSNYQLRLENTTTIWDVDRDFSDRTFRELYFKQRPGGVHVASFIDLVASDRDVIYTRDLGRFELVLRTGPNAPANNPANNYVRIVVQRLVYLERAAIY